MTLSINCSGSTLLIRLMQLCGLVQTHCDGAYKSNEAIFRQIYTLHSRVVDKVCFTYATDRDDFDDLRQDAWLNIWRGIDSYRGDSKPATWIYRVAINTCVSTVRSKKKHSGNVRIDAADLYTADTADNDSIQRLHYLLSCLNPVDRSIVMLRLEDLEYEEIALIMGMPRNTIATRLRRARLRLIELNKRKDI